MNVFQYQTADFNNAKLQLLLHQPNIYPFPLEPPFTPPIPPL